MVSCLLILSAISSDLLMSPHLISCRQVPESLMRTTQSIIAAKNEWEQAKHRIIPERDIWWEQREGKQLKVSNNEIGGQKREKK